MPKVLHIVYNLIRGGTEGQCARVAMALARRSSAQRVAVFQKEGFFLQPVETVCGSVHVMPIRRLLDPRNVKVIEETVQFIRAEGIEVVHAWDADAAIFGSIAARRARVPFISSRRDLGQIYAAWKAWLMHRADLGAAAVVVNATAIRELVERRGVPGKKIHTIYNMLDISEFDKQAGAPWIHVAPLPMGRLVGMVARLDPEKGTATLIRAVEKIHAEYPDVGFVIAGDGVQKPMLEMDVRQRDLDLCVRFLGDVKEVPVLLRRLFAGVLLPVSNEGLSNSILEYMAARLPVVATDCGGNRELVEDSITGFLVPVNDSDAVAAALIRLLGNPSLAKAMGRAGRELVEQRHGPDTIVEQFDELYRKVVAGG